MYIFFSREDIEQIEQIQPYTHDEATHDAQDMLAGSLNPLYATYTAYTMHCFTVSTTK